MSWNMSNQKKVISGKLKDLFAEGVYQCWEYIVEEIDVCQFYAEPQYEQMGKEEKIAALYFVWKALTDEAFAEPKQTAWSEATIFTVFKLVEMQLDIERDYGESRWAELLESAWDEYLEQECEYDEDPDDETKIEHLADVILWDRDWQDIVVDPEIRGILGIDNGYYKGCVKEVFYEQAEAFFAEQLKDRQGELSC
jgi:hypothetical protein